MVISKSPKLWTIILTVVFISILVISRVYNLNKTARFLWDESSDLVNIHQIYVEKKLTLIGPISEDGSKVFGSLTYYILLPFAVLGNFDPVSTAYGAAFWGTLSGILICLLAYKINRKSLYLIAPITILWYPLMETGRWAWNPNLIPFWVTLSLIFFLKKGRLPLFLSGLFIGLSVHLHYLAIFTAIGLGIVVLTETFNSKKLREFFIFLTGLTLAILPFVIFDMRHPPGLFLSRILYFNNLGSPGSTNFIQSLFSVLSITFRYFTQSVLLEIALIISVLGLLIADIKSRSRSTRFAIVFLIQIFGVSFVSNFYIHYIIPAIPFFIVYLIFPRKGTGKILAYLSLSIILASSIFSFPRQITKVTWEDDIASTRYITGVIRTAILSTEMKNVNVAVLGSPDPNTYGRKYRDLLLISGIDLRSKGEYEISDSLFVVTTETQETVRKDPAYEIKFFRNGPLVGEWKVPNGVWNIYLFSKPI